jgi:hypothetical protein
MEYERDPYGLYRLFGHDAHEFHYSKDDRIGRKGTSVKLSSGGKSLKMCICWKLTNQIAFH